MNRILVGPQTRLSKFESRELRAPLYVYCRWVMTRQWRFTLKWRNEVDTHEHAMPVVPATHGRARSQPFTIDKYKSSETNLIHTFSDHFNFGVWFHPLYHILAFRDWCQSTFATFGPILRCLACLVYILIGNMDICQKPGKPSLDMNLEYMKNFFLT